MVYQLYLPFSHSGGDNFCRMKSVQCRSVRPNVNVSCLSICSFCSTFYMMLKHIFNLSNGPGLAPCGN